MKIACLQFAPQLGEVEDNIRRAEAVLVKASQDALNLDLLVLPELAFTGAALGYNFTSLEAIKPYLEPTTAGRSTQWAISTAKRLGCYVVIGYPEAATEPPIDSRPSKPAPHDLDDFQTLGTPVIPNRDPSFPHNYNSTVTVSPEGEVVAHYRKSHLYYTDATWAREGSGFYAGHAFSASPKSQLKELKVGMGICMDLNNYNFTAPWTAWEFANHIVSSQVDVAVVCMAWLSSSLTPDDISGAASLEPEVSTLSYWVERLRPVMDRRRADGRKTIVVLANRSGIEPGEDKEVCYAGTSLVMEMGDGQVSIWDMLGKGEEKLLVVDTEDDPKYTLRPKTTETMGSSNGGS